MSEENQVQPGDDSQVGDQSGQSSGQGWQPIVDMPEEKVDAIIGDLLGLHDPSVTVDIPQFLDLIKHSLSLSAAEKKRVIDAAPTLSQHQFDELSKVFLDEREKFRELVVEHPEDVKRLVEKQQSDWIILGDMYRIEFEKMMGEQQDDQKIDDIKKSLGL